MKRFVPVLLCVAPVAVAIACYGPTQMAVEVQTDLRCAEQLRSALYAGGVGEAIAETAESECTPLDAVTTSLGDLVLAPGSDRKQSVSFKVKLGVGVDAQGNRVDAKRCEQGVAGCVVASRRFTYAEHEQRRIVVRLYRDCLAKVCGDGQTCIQGGACVSDEVQCQGSDCRVETEAPFTVPPAVDAGADVAVPVDAEADAPSNACAGPRGDGVLVEQASLRGTAGTDAAIYWLDRPGGVPGTLNVLRRVNKSSGLVEKVSTADGMSVTGFALEAESAWYSAVAGQATTLYVPSETMPGTTASLLMPNVSSPEALAFVPGQGLFIGTASFIHKYVRDGGGPTYFVTEYGATAFAFDQQRLLAIEPAGTLHTIPLANAVGRTPVLGNATAVVADATKAFCAAAAGTAPTGIYEVIGVGPSLYLLTATAVSALALDSTRLFWVEGSRIYAGPRTKPAGTVMPTEIVNSATPIKALNVDSGPTGCVYYWTASTMGDTLRVRPK